jgi:diguanylate cyclase (GGDEF)-like protein
MICTSVMTLVVALSLTFIWFFERREKAVAWWCLSMWMGTAASLLLAFRLATPWWLGMGLGNAFALLAYGLIWAGFVSFRGRKVNLYGVFAGSAFWVVCIYGSEVIRGDVNNRIIVSSIGISLYCLLLVGDTWQTWKQERLPSVIIAGFVYASHGLFYAIRIPLTLAYPVQEVTLFSGWTWYTTITLEAFVHGMFSSFIFVILVRERAERRYRQAAEIDSLTLVSSRRHFVSETRASLARSPKSAVLAVLDLDYFKTVNDTYGHMAGDRVLQSFAHSVSSQLQPGMVFGRLGGEEFGLYMSDMPEAEVQARLEQIRAGVEALEIGFNGNVLKITISIGAASAAEAGFDFDHLMAAADNALYLCKREGRNRVGLFSLGMRLEKIIENDVQSRVSLSKQRVSRILVRSRLGRS